MKVLLYGSFIFLVPLLILAGGIHKYKIWITMVFSLSLWPSLFSMLNMIIDFAYEPAKIVSYSSWATESNKFDSIASLAASLTISIPFFAYWITSMSGGGFSHLAGTMMGSINAATGAVAAEKSVGSRGWDNDSINNSSRNNSNAFKTNHNMEYASNEQAWNNFDGARVKTTASGQQIITGGAGITSDVGETRYGMEQSRIGQVNDGAQRSEEKLASDTRSLSNAKSNTFSETKDWIKSLAEREAGGKTVNYESMGEQGKNVQQMVSTAKTLAKDYGYNYDQAVEGALTGNISGSIPGKFFGVGASISADGKISARNLSTQQFSEKEQTDRNNQFAENYNNAVKAAQNQTHSEDKTVDKSQSSRVSSAYEEQQRQEASVSKARHESEAWHQAQNVINSSGGSSNKDMTKDVIDRYMQESGINDRNVAHQHVSNRTPEVMKVWNRMLSEDHYVQDVVSNIAGTKSNVSQEAAAGELDRFTKDNQIERGANDHRVEQAANDSGFKGQDIERQVAAQKEQLNQKYTDMNSENNDRHVGVKYGITTQEQGLQAKIDKFEKDRIGQGRVGTVWGLIDGVGSPKGITDLNELGTPAYSNASTSNANTADLEHLQSDFKPYNGNRSVNTVNIPKINNLPNGGDGQKAN